MFLESSAATWVRDTELPEAELSLRSRRGVQTTEERLSRCVERDKQCQSRRKKRENKMYVGAVRHLAVMRMLLQSQRTTQELYTKELRGGREVQCCQVEPSVQRDPHKNKFLT